MKVYGVVYASVFDEDNIFLHEGDAVRFKRHLCRRHKLKFNDAMLRILTIEVQESYDANRYRVKRVKAEKPTDVKKEEVKT